MEPWWVEYSNQLKAEEDGLNRLDYDWRIIPGSMESGVLMMSIMVPADGLILDIEAKYPDSYPYFPPEVYLKNKDLVRHQHLVGKNLCLLAGEGKDWDPAADTLAILLEHQLPKVLEIERLGADSDYAAEREDRIAEPFSSFLDYLPFSSILVPDELPPKDVSFGKLTLKGNKQIKNGRPLVCAVLDKMADSEGNVLVSTSFGVPSRHEPFFGFFLRLQGRPENKVADAPNLLCQKMQKCIPEFQKALDKGKKGEIFIVGFVYSDEVGWRDEKDDWVFMAIEVMQPRRKSRPVSYRLHFLRADWSGQEAHFRRAPFLRPLKQKSVLIVGLGSLGSPLAIDLAKSGIGSLYLIDGDVIQAGNSVRWALGARYAGFYKTHAIGEHLVNEYPHTSVYSYVLRIGQAGNGNQELKLLQELLEKIDLVVDATANFQVNHFLSDLCRYKAKPFLWLTTTHGCQGGVVGRVMPGVQQGCWHCFQHSLGDETIRLPKDSGENSIQPGGCNQATFEGAGIDSDEVAKLAGRVAVATLCRGCDGGYRDFDWNVAVGDFFDESGPIAPIWSTYELLTHPCCLACKSEAGKDVDQ